MSVLHLFSKIRTTFCRASPLDFFDISLNMLPSALQRSARGRKEKKSAKACGLLVVIASNLFQNIFVLIGFSRNDVFVFKRLAL